VPHLRIYDYWEATDINGQPHKAGSLSEPIDIEIDGYIDDDTVSLATSTTLTVWDSAEALTDFDFFWLKADQDLYVELTCDRGAEVGTEELAFVIEANTPFRLIYDDALALYTTNFAALTADVIDRVRVRNVSGTTASIRRAIIT
jgi:hypothetical protein